MSATRKHVVRKIVVVVVQDGNINITLVSTLHIAPALHYSIALQSSATTTTTTTAALKCPSLATNQTSAIIILSGQQSAAAAASR